MRKTVSKTVALALLAGSTAALAQTAPPSADSLDMPSYQEPAQSWRDIQDPIERERCKEKIRQVRAEAGKPEIDSEQETADPEKPLVIAAVDQSVDGCKVLVMKQDTSDIRPVPEPRKGPVRIEPAN